jgi:hypothetical protein
MKLLPVIALLSAGLLVGCSATLKPKITATLPAAPPPMHFDVNGSGFSQTASCATVSLLGMPSGPAVVHMKDPACTNGKFRFDWDYTYVSGCTLSASQQVFVLAIDNPTLDPAIAGVSIAWGPNCAFAGTCGKIGQYPCPGGCLEGSTFTSTLCACGVQGEVACTTGKKCQSNLAPVQQGSNSLCEPCGGKGQPSCISGDKCQSNLTPVQQGSNSVCQPCGQELQPVCAEGNACQSGLNPGLPPQGVGVTGVVCTATCGYAGGAVCTPAMEASGLCEGRPPMINPAAGELPCQTLTNGTTVWTCYDSIMSSCSCVASNSCKKSVATGSCNGPGACKN